MTPLGSLSVKRESTKTKNHSLILNYKNSFFAEYVTCDVL